MAAATPAPWLMLLLFNLLVLGGVLGADDNWSDWKSGRATYYGTDAWSIHRGSCGYGWLDENVATGWDIAAISDKAADYSGSCGKCKEVRCKPGNFADGYGQWLDRSNVCFNDYASVVVMITDTCPCIYPTNYDSNKRWCCGDMYHIDLSVWSYEKLADKKWGVIGIQWRDVPCWYKPTAKANLPWYSKKSPQPWWEQPPSGWNPAMDQRPFGPRFQSWGKRRSSRRLLH